MMTVPLHGRLRVAGAFDTDPDRMKKFSAYHGVRAYDSYQDLLGDDRVDIVVNLTNPRSHFAVSKAALEAGKHVYSEKPLALDLKEAEELVDLSLRCGRVLAGAPCTLLGETAQTMWKAIRREMAGTIRIIYAEMDEGMVPIAPYASWKSPSGVAWPYRDEFETGCTLEHAGYCLTWLAAFFGPAIEVTSFSSTLIGDKKTALPLDHNAPDFSVACLKFQDGVVARITNSIVAPHDHSFRIIGDRGVLYTRDSWSIRSPVYFKPWLRVRRRLMLHPLPRRVARAKSGAARPKSGGAQRMDFAAGIDELADSIQESRPCRLSARFALHVTELALAITNASGQPQPYAVKHRFDPIAWMDWAN
jgi:predicted dehydrogenase